MKHTLENRAITVTYIGPSNRRPARLRASCGEAITFVTYDHELNVTMNYIETAMAHMTKMGWEGVLLGGYTKNGAVFVIREDK